MIIFQNGKIFIAEPLYKINKLKKFKITIDKRAIWWYNKHGFVPLDAF